MKSENIRRDKIPTKLLQEEQLQETHYFLEGPHSKLKELWFIIKVFFEFFKGLRVLHNIGPSVTVLGQLASPRITNITS